MAAPLKLPIVITVDNGKATAGLKQFEKQGLTIKGMFKGLRSEARGIGMGIIGQYFGIQAAINGIRSLITMGQDLQKMAGGINATIAREQAQTEIAQFYRDKRVAKDIEPTTVMTEQQKRENMQRGTGPEQLASSIALQAEELKGVFGTAIDSIIGPQSGADARDNAQAARDAQDKAFAAYIPDFALSARDSVMGFFGQLGTAKQAAYDDPTGGNLGSSGIAIAQQSSTTDANLAAAMGASTLAELQEINRNLRGQR